MTARENLLAEEKRVTHERDALAAKRRRMPWMAVEKQYEFDGPDGKVACSICLRAGRQLIVYRAFFEPGVFGWPDHACRGCSLGPTRSQPVASERPRYHACLCLARAAGGHCSA